MGEADMKSNQNNDIIDIKYELFETQAQIIQLQSDAIKELFLLLMLQTNITDEDTSKAVEKINEAARLRAEHRL